MLRYTTDSLDRARPGLVALHDIRPGNGAGQFLQPQSRHRATVDGTNPLVQEHMIHWIHYWTLCWFLQE